MTVPQRLCVSLRSRQTAILPLNSAYWAFSTFEMHGSIAFSESSERIECASPILMSKFNLQAIILRKVPQTGNQSMAGTSAFFAGRLRASPLLSMIKTQYAKSKIVG